MANNLLNRSDVSLENPAFSGMLHNLQANILKHHGRKHAWHLFIQFIPGKEQEIKSWIRIKLAGEETGRITSAHKQLQDAALRKQSKARLFDGGAVTSFFLSAKGYARLGFDWEKETEFNFFKSLKERGPANTANPNLNDPEVLTWELPFQLEIHAMLLVADQKTKRVKTIVKEIEAETNGIARILCIEKGEILRNGQDQPIEHFGYVDGISQPRFLAGEQQPGNDWNDAAPLGTVLIEDPFAGKDCYGSFMVFRKLEQNVKLFHEKRTALRDKLFTGENTEGDIKLAGAFVIGRFEDGSPVTLHSGEQNAHNMNNDFNYSNDEGARCPLHAHIRTTNPRVPDHLKNFIRIVRRGITYDEAGRNGVPSVHPEKGVGLFFISYQANIETQFERIQKWSNTGIVQMDRRRGVDGIVGQGINNFIQLWPRAWNAQCCLVQENLFRDVIILKGGEYFFTPSIPFLKNI